MVSVKIDPCSTIIYFYIYVSQKLDSLEMVYSPKGLFTEPTYKKIF